MEIDPLFQVEIDYTASSPLPVFAIYKGQHGCVSEGWSHQFKVPDNAGEIIIREQMTKKHFSVLRKAFVSFSCKGFPHSVVAQITRHQDSSFLVQSGRYTGKRFVKVALQQLLPEQVFYMRPVGKHSSREGIYERTAEMNNKRWKLIEDACKLYNEEIQAGIPFEDARGILPYDFRQNFDISGDLQAIFHLLDQRTLMDSQAEIRILADMMIGRLMQWCPELTDWYIENRYQKNLLAP